MWVRYFFVEKIIKFSSNCVLCTNYRSLCFYWEKVTENEIFVAIKPDGKVRKFWKEISMSIGALVFLKTDEKYHDYNNICFWPFLKLVNKFRVFLTYWNLDHLWVWLLLRADFLNYQRATWNSLCSNNLRCCGVLSRKVSKGFAFVTCFVDICLLFTLCTWACVVCIISYYSVFMYITAKPLCSVYSLIKI